MPANKKYLLKSRLGRTSKILAAIFGGAFISCLLHILTAFVIDPELMILSIWITFPLSWVAVMAMVYGIKSPFRVWMVILSIGLIAVPLIYYLKMS
ncbi:MAG: hypothetical protein AAF693_20135 [Bacteroidota bacterium]